MSSCVESLIDQTYPNFEIILVDDESPDNCPAICEDYASRYDNIRVIHQKNKGLSGARNSGMNKAYGELYTFVDSDDSVKPDMLHKLYKTLSENSADIATSGYFEGKPTGGVLSSEKAIRCILKENTTLSTSAWGKLYKAELFEDIKYPEGLLFEDYATAPLLFDKAGKIAHTDEVLYNYRMDNTEGITHSAFSQKRMEYFTVSDMVDEFLKKSYPGLLKYARRRATRYAISFYRQLAQSGNRDKETEKILTRYTRRGILPYIFSSYRVTSKAYGILISICPPVALKMFSRK